MRQGIIDRLAKVEARKAPGTPNMAAVIEPLPGEGNQEAKVRYFAAHPEQIGAPVIILRLSREAL